MSFRRNSASWRPPSALGRAGAAVVLAACAPEVAERLAGGRHTACLLHEDGSLDCAMVDYAWGHGFDVEEVPRGSWVDVAVGVDAVCGLAPSGLVRCWSNSGAAVDGDMEVDFERFVRVFGGYGQMCGLREDGTAYCWGNRALFGQGPQGVVFTALAPTETHVCGIGRSQALICWGYPDFVGLDPPEGRYVEVAAAAGTDCAVTEAGRIDCWGALDEWTMDDVPAGEGYHELVLGPFHGCALDAEGRAACWGGNQWGQSEPPSDERFTQLAAGYAFTCGLREDGEVECWGCREYEGWEHQCEGPR